jgi:hypothetical protein
MTSSNAFYNVATLTLPAGNYLITSKVTVANAGGGDVEVVCQLYPLSGNYAQADLLPDNGTVGIWLATLPLETVATFGTTTAVTLECEAAPGPLTVFLYYPSIIATPVTTVTTQ